MEIVPSLNACQKYMRKNIKREKREGERERVWNKVVPSLSAAQYIYLRLQSINLAVSVQSINQVESMKGKKERKETDGVY